MASINVYQLVSVIMYVISFFRLEIFIYFVGLFFVLLLALVLV